MVSRAGIPSLDLPEAIHLTAELPSRMDSDSWFVTADPESIRGRSDLARTILVGPKRAPGPLPLPRVDVEARDLSAAVIEILTRQGCRAGPRRRTLRSDLAGRGRSVPVRAIARSIAVRAIARSYGQSVIPALARRVGAEGPLEGLIGSPWTARSLPGGARRCLVTRRA